MGILDIFLNQSKHKKRKKKGRSVNENLFSSKINGVKKMVEIPIEEARYKSIELLDLLISMHRQTNVADHVTDTQILQSIRTMLSDLQAEDREIDTLRTNLLKKYAEQLYNELFNFVEINKDTYIDFADTSVIMNHAEEIIDNELLNNDELSNVIDDMKNHFN